MAMIQRHVAATFLVLTALLHASRAYVLFCYYESWSATRPGVAGFPPEKIPPHLCTHIVFAFARLKDDAIIEGGWMDETHNGLKAKGLYTRINALKSRNSALKVLLAIGGWGADDSEYSRTVSTSSHRKTFAKNAISYLRKWGFDGLDIDWEYPEGDDRQKFTLWSQVILDAFVKESAKDRLLLTAAVMATSEAPKHYEIGKLGKIFDFIHLMAYDYTGTWKGKTSFNTPIDSVEMAVKTWTGESFPSKKLVLGMAAYSRTFTLPGPTNVKPGVKTSQGGEKGFYSAAAGTLFYFEICRYIRESDWTSVWDVTAAAPYAYKGVQWVTYDNIRSISIKVDLIVERDLAGGMVWAMGQDDFWGMCGDGSFPLISTMNYRLGIGKPPKAEGLFDPVLSCYYTSWSATRRSIASFPPEKIPPHLCTHIVFAFAKLKDDNIVGGDWQDEALNGNAAKGLYARLNALKERNPTLKVLLAIGGWGADEKQYSGTVSTDRRRKQFAKNAVAYLRKWDFDGLDLDWEYPKGQDRERFTFWCEAIHAAFVNEPLKPGRRRLLLTAAVMASQAASKHYEIEKLGLLLDFVQLMTYDFAGIWNKRTSFNAPSDKIKGAISVWKGGKFPANKIVLGMAAYGRSFTLPNPIVVTPGTRTSQAGAKGIFSGEKGVLFYFEVCLNLNNNGWTSRWDSQAAAPYAYHRNQWVTYDDIRSVNAKVDIVKEQNLRGAMVWEMGMDDFSGVCKDGPFPIIGTINQRLLPGHSAALSASREYVVVCYYESWSATRPGIGGFPPEKISPDLCTHIVFAFAKLKNDAIVEGGWMDERYVGRKEQGLYTRINALKAKNPRLKVLLAIGGWGADESEFAGTVSLSDRRSTFAWNAIRYLRTWGFDGLDLDWEYPTGANKERFTLWCKAISVAFTAEVAGSRKTRLLLTAAVKGAKGAEKNYEIDKLGSYLDFVHIMTYDFAGTWNGKTSFNAPINLVEAGVSVWTDGFFPSNKLVLGMAAYGRTFTLPNPLDTSPGVTSWMAGDPGPHSKSRGTFFYYEVCINLVRNGWVSVWDAKSAVPYAYKGDQWVTYDNPRSINAKVDLIEARALAGGMVWAMGQDDFSNVCGGGAHPIIGTINKRLLKDQGWTPASFHVFPAYLKSDASVAIQASPIVAIVMTVPFTRIVYAL